MTIPPLSQSRQMDMACSLNYYARHISHINIESEPARRGIEIHRVLAQYMDALKITKQQTDYAKMAELSAGASPDAKEVLDRFAESNFYDFDKIFDTELYISADEDFNIVDVHGQSRRDDVRVPGTAYEGSIDVLVMESETEATIIDFKSYFSIIDADTFQSEMYTLLVFLLNPQIQTITFTLSFVRYGAAKRNATWTREDIPKLKRHAQRERARQIELHSANPENLKPTPGKVCVYCPLVLSGCPMQKVNPYGNLTKQERVALALWMNAAKKHNDKVIKDWMIEDGPITYKDANQVEYISEFRKQDRRSYPLRDGFELLCQWMEAHPSDRDLAGKLSISGLSAVLKAYKRSALSEEMNSIARVTTITKLFIGRPDEANDNGDE